MVVMPPGDPEVASSEMRAVTIKVVVYSSLRRASVGAFATRSRAMLEWRSPHYRVMDR